MEEKEFLLMLRQITEMLPKLKEVVDYYDKEKIAREKELMDENQPSAEALQWVRDQQQREDAEKQRRERMQPLMR